VSKTLANGWLFYSYGVAPLMGDLYNGLEVLEREPPGKTFRSSRNGIMSPWTLTTPLRANSGRFQKIDLQVRVTMGATVEVKNPQRRLLQQWGLTNPVQWINEAIPFSFVADWFSNLSQVISSIDDFEGLKVTNSWTSTRYRLVSEQREWGSYGNPNGNWVKTRNVYVRTVGLTLPQLRFEYERVQWRRGLNAISLLVGFLPKGKR
jgi:hypothetical protein